MTAIGRNEVLHVARLAALEVPEAELPQLVEQLQRIVAMVDQLAEVEVAGAPPFQAGPEAAQLRQDALAPDHLIGHEQTRGKWGFAAHRDIC